MFNYFCDSLSASNFVDNAVCCINFNMISVFQPLGGNFRAVDARIPSSRLTTAAWLVMPPSPVTIAVVFLYYKHFGSGHGRYRHVVS